MLRIEEEPHKIFKREGQNLFASKTISIADAIRGGEIEVPTLDGPCKVKIDSGTQPGTVIRLRGKGLPAVSGYGYGTGDLNVKLDVYIPKRVSFRDRDLLDKIAEAESFQVK